MKNSLLYGDNLPIMRERIATETADLVYLDHPFKSDLNHSVGFSDVFLGFPADVKVILGYGSSGVFRSHRGGDSLLAHNFLRRSDPYFSSL
jgi:hypothetical protein